MFYYTDEQEKNIISALCDAALKSSGLECLGVVNYINKNLQQVGEEGQKVKKVEVKDELGIDNKTEIIREAPKKEEKKKPRGRPKKSK